jgi:GDPmannose 4,6-dehydratase
MRALVFGGSGQAGGYMVEFLKRKEYEVSTPTFHFDAFYFNLWLRDLIANNKVDEIYNFAAKTSKKDSWDNPAKFMQVNGVAVLMMLEEIARHCPTAKFFNAGSADVFNKKSLRAGATEESDRGPCNPYGLSKCMAEDAVNFYRHHTNLFACTGIFFNMESPRRRDGFVRYVVSEVVRMHQENDAHGKVLTPAEFGSLSVVRDWGLTQEYVEAAWMMLQSNTPADYVIATGESRSCAEFVVEALGVVGLDFREGAVQLHITPEAAREAIADVMRADPRKIKNELGWEAQSKFKQVVRTLVEAELARPKESALGKSNSIG